MPNDDWLDKLKAFEGVMNNPSDARRFRRLLRNIEADRQAASDALYISRQSSSRDSTLSPVQEFVRHVS